MSIYDDDNADDDSYTMLTLAKPIDFDDAYLMMMIDDAYVMMMPTIHI